MSFNITVEGGTSARLPTKGKYCDRDIVITASGGGDTSMEDGFIDRTITEYRNDRVTEIGGYAFRGCDKLVSVNFPMVESIGTYAFYECGKLIEIHFPRVKTIKTYAFRMCAAIEVADISTVEKIESYAFYNCKKLSEINAPLLNVVGSSSFYGCSALHGVVLPSATNIQSSAFAGCTLLGNFVAPMAQNIYASVFRNCYALKSITLANTERVCELTNANAFEGTPIADGAGYIYVPADLVDSYKVATNWSTYANQIVAIPE